jgi:hypothetical protein
MRARRALLFVTISSANLQIDEGATRSKIHPAAVRECTLTTYSRPLVEREYNEKRATIFQIPTVLDDYSTVQHGIRENTIPK